jgi:heptosyltransferase-3
MANKRIIIYRFGQLGDTIAAIPSIVALRRHFPGRQFTLLSESPADASHLPPSTVLAPMELIDDFQTYAPPRSLRGMIGLIRTLWKLSRHAEALIYLVPSVRPSRSQRRDLLIFRLAGFRKILATKGFPPNLQPRDANNQLQPVLHESAALLHRLTLDGINVPPTDHIDLAITNNERGMARQWIESHGLSNKAWFAVCPGSKWASKLWPIENFAALGKSLAEATQMIPVIVGGKEDQATAERLLTAWGTGFCAAGSLGVRESAALLENAQFYVGNDTGAMHLAAAVRTPCVAIFSAQDWPGRWEPMNQDVGHIVLRSHVPCAGCLSAHCPNDVVCLRQITPEQAFHACLQLLANRKAHAI